MNDNVLVADTVNPAEEKAEKQPEATEQKKEPKTFTRDELNKYIAIEAEKARKAEREKVLEQVNAIRNVYNVSLEKGVNNALKEKAPKTVSPDAGTNVSDSLSSLDVMSYRVAVLYTSLSVGFCLPSTFAP